jgi:hypothetical protein
MIAGRFDGGSNGEHIAFQRRANMTLDLSASD